MWVVGSETKVMMNNNLLARKCVHGVKAPKERKVFTDDDFYKLVFKEMTEDEQLTYHRNRFAGTCDFRSNIIMMGSEAMERYIKFKNEMIQKYTV